MSSLGYTVGDTMDEPMLRDVERWKERIEVRLDNRQVFFLFFGSALVACLLFVLGVIVGKRLESRGHAAAPEMEDPLALLDKVAATSIGQGREEDDSLSERLRQRAKVDAPKSAPAAAPSSLPAVVVRPKADLPVAAAPAVKAPENKPSVTKTENAVLAMAPKADAKADAVKADAKAVAAKEPVKPEAKAETTKAVAKAEPAKESGKDVAKADATGKRRFTLQLSSFQDRAEAEAFAQKFPGAYIVKSDIPEKGVWYRVRTGDYGSADEAVSAKSNFEREHHVIAYVAPR